MGKLKIFLVRHGEDFDNQNGILNGRRNTPLTLKGIQNAMKLGDGIDKLNLNINHIYSSPLDRALSTAKILSKYLATKSPIVLDNLIERDFGILTGKPHAKIKEICEPDIFYTEQVAYFLNPEGAETFPELLKRAKKVLNYIFSQHLKGNVLLVSHGDIGKMLFASYFNLAWKESLGIYYFGNADMIELSEDATPESSHVLSISLRETRKQGLWDVESNS